MCINYNKKVNSKEIIIKMTEKKKLPPGEHIKLNSNAAKSIEELVSMTEKLTEELKRIGLTLNAKKTKTTSIVASLIE